MSKLKESNLTMDKQRSQLQMLTNDSKNLKSGNKQPADRQEPLGNLVQKLSLQEKALVQFLRMNYCIKFMLSNVFV